MVAFCRSFDFGVPWYMDPTGLRNASSHGCEEPRWAEPTSASQAVASVHSYTVCDERWDLAPAV